MKKMNKNGFTIVELVIVIAVIGILAAVLIPTFSNIIKKANQSKDMQEAKNTYMMLVNKYDIYGKYSCLVETEDYFYLVNDSNFYVTPILKSDIVNNQLEVSFDDDHFLIILKDHPKILNEENNIKVIEITKEINNNVIQITEEEDSSNIELEEEDTPEVLGEAYLKVSSSSSIFYHIYLKHIVFDTSSNAFWDQVDLTNKTLGSDIYYYYDKITTGSSYYYDLYVLSSKKIYAPKNSSKMFYNLSELESITFNNFDGSKIENLNYIFEGCTNLTTLDLAYFNSIVCTKYTNMLKDTTNLSTILNYENFIFNADPTNMAVLRNNPYYEILNQKIVKK